VAEECAAQFAVESSPREARVAAAERVVGDLLERCRRAELPLPAQLAARAAVLAGDIAVRDAICASMRRRDASTHVQLWTDVLRGAPPPHDVAPATVLGFAAWLAGNGVLARCALSRAVGGAPADRLVRLLSDLLQHAVSSDLWPGVDGDRVG
jgi:hypothetical protein